MRYEEELLILMDSACDSFESEVWAGSIPKIEQYLLLVPDSPHRSSLFEELLVIELDHLQKIEETICASDYLERFPQYQQQIERIVASMNTTAQENQSTHSFAQKTELVHSTLPSTPCEDSPNLDKMVGSLFRNYRIVKLIGGGGMGQVYLAIDTLHGDREVAIKFLKIQSETSTDRDRFFREMEISWSLQHSSIVLWLDSGDEGNLLFIAMEYCNAGNLSELLKRVSFLTTRRAVRLLDRLLAGVAVGHRSGIVHRDLKPQNILLHRYPSGKYHPKISDFGLAKNFLQAGESGMTVSGSVGGSWHYMPREQLTNFRYVSPSSDVWSLGAIFYECLTGKLPRPHLMGADPIQTILQSETIPISEVMPDNDIELFQFVDRCLDVTPGARFCDATQMRKALHKVATKLNIQLE